MADSVPGTFAAALIAYEDEAFLHHPGIDVSAIVRAAIVNIRAGEVKSGGSTLTMQLARMARGNRKRTYWQKAIEIGLALKLELHHSKDELLNLYAAHAPFGGNVVGLSAASWRYFHRPSHLLSWSEAAALAVMPNSPALIYPGRNEQHLHQKRDQLLEKLHEKGHFTTSDLALYKLEPLPGKPLPLPGMAPHLLARAMQEGHRGQILHSTINARMQQTVAGLVKRHHAIARGNEVHNMAALVVRVTDGQALAYVGNVHSEGDHGQHTDLVSAQRSTGSLLKPLLYAAAMDEGLILPQQLMADVPVFYQGFAPQNFDKQYNGAVAADQALSRSLNVPFVTLLRDYGYERFHHLLQRAQYSSMTHPASHYGLSMILGGSESSLWEMTALYAGTLRTLHTYNRRKGRERYAEQDFGANTYLQRDRADRTYSHTPGAFSAGAIWHMLKAMQALRRPDEMAGWKMFDASVPIAWKTGTSFGFRDAWAIGMSDDLVVGVWAGNADGEGRPGLTGVSVAAPLMFDIFDVLETEARFPKPVAALRSIRTCAASGMKAGPHCHAFQHIDIPAHIDNTPACSYCMLLHLDAGGSHQVHSGCYPVQQMRHEARFVLPTIQAWYYKKHHPEYSAPPSFASSCSPWQTPKIMQLIYPKQLTRVHVPRELDGSRGAVIFELAHRQPHTQVYWYLDEQYLGSTSEHHHMALQPTTGQHVLHIVDEAGNDLSQPFEVVGG